MATQLGDYTEELEALAPALRELLEASWHAATRVLSPGGLDRYVKGAGALTRLGKGDDLVQAWLDAVPQVAAEVGDDAVGALLGAALALASKTSGGVIERLLATAPTAARRLGDAELFGAYLQFVSLLSAQAPRGLRPMFDQLETLLGQLTLGGMRRWANWGAHAYRTDYPEQVRYFSLASRESQAMLQQERKGVLLVDVQRRIHMYLRALWARDFFMRPTSGDFENREGLRPFIEGHLLHLPDAVDETLGVPGLELYRAMAAHAAAHVAAAQRPLSAQELGPLHMAVIGLIEDARVEELAMRRFPGLRQLWSRLHAATPEQGDGVRDLFERLGRALLDASYVDPDPWVAQGRELFAAALDRLDDNRIAWDIGVTLAHALIARRLPFHARHDVPRVPYRDDNRFVWAYEPFDLEGGDAAGPHAERQVRRRVSLMEMVNEVDNEFAGDDAQEVWVLPTEFHLDQEGCTINELEGREPVSDPFHYPEWDYQLQLDRPSWATLFEHRARRADPAPIEAIAQQYRREIQRMKYLLDALQPQGVQRIRRLEDGDEIDVGAALDAQVDIAMRRQPDPRIMMRSVRKTRDFAILVLLDLSQSTNDRVPGQEHSVLDLTRQACVLLADSIDRVGDPFAIHGFCSDGRHDVQYRRFKDFDEGWGVDAKARLAGMNGELSTRMGCAIRHAGRLLAQRPASKRLLLVVTDGEPADVDARDPQYLRADARKAVEEVGRAGVVTFCMSLDPRADQYVARIFGQRNYMVVDHAQRLPEKLPQLYASLTR